MTSILATTVAPAVPVQIKAAARVSVDRDSVPVFVVEPVADKPGGQAEARALEAGRAGLPAAPQPLSPSMMAMMLEVQERLADRDRLRGRWNAPSDDRTAEAEGRSPAAADRFYGGRSAA